MRRTLVAIPDIPTLMEVHRGWWWVTSKNPRTRWAAGREPAPHHVERNFRCVGGAAAPCWPRRYAACFLSSTPASHMASTAVRYLTLQRVDGSTQRTSVVVTDPLLCPPELDLVTRVSRPLYLFVGGVLAPRRLASPQSLSCAIQHVYSLVPLRRRRLLLLYSHRHW